MSEPILEPEKQRVDQDVLREEPKTWPVEPYRGLPYYGPNDQPLYAGREADTKSCSALLLQSTTRTLVLHGATGCGKSSFLRAGLIPYVETNGLFSRFHRLDPADLKSKVIFIRCTNAPLIPLAAEIFQIASTPFPTGREQSLDLTEALGGYTTAETFREACIQHGDRFLLRAMAKIASKLPITLILVLDQAEEVLTFNRGDKVPEHQRDFFYFLQDFNSLPIDLKLVISLRTEFFGRFYDAMSVPQILASDARQYLLKDFDAPMLLKAIERPTLESEVDGWPPPIETYKFKFEGELANTIKEDLMAERQVDGVLSVMQIVCKSLYDLAPANTSENQAIRTLTESQYRDLGAVHGSIDKHITKMLQKVFLEMKLSGGAAAEEEKRWRNVLCSLLIVQQDGTVTTDALENDRFIEVAEKAEVKLPARDVIDRLLAPDVVLLRRLSLVNGRTGKTIDSYSLGHDVLGLALRRWRDAKREAEAHESKLRRFYLYSGGGIVLSIVLALVGWLFFSASLKRGLNQREATEEALRLSALSHSLRASNSRLALLTAVAATIEARNGDSGYRTEDQKGSDGPSATLKDDLTYAPATLALISTSVASHVIPGCLQANCDRFFMTPSGDRLLVANLNGTRGAVEIDLSGGSPEVLNAVAGSMLQAAYWSQDGTQPLLMSDRQIQLTNSGKILSLPLASVQQIRIGTSQRNYLLSPFGWESMLVQQPHDITDFLAKRTSLETPPLFTLGRAVTAELFPGNRSSFLATSSSQGAKANLVVQDANRGSGFYLFHADTIQSRSDAVNSEVLRAHLELLAKSFAPDDSAVMAVVTFQGVVIARVAVMNLAGQSSLASCDLPPGNSTISAVAVGTVGTAQASIAVATLNDWGQLLLRHVVNPTGSTEPKHRCKFAKLEDKSNPFEVADDQHELYGAKDVQQLSFTQSGGYLAGIRADGVLLLWNTDLPGNRRRIDALSESQGIKGLVAEACRLAGRDMTDDEKMIYLGDKNRTVCR